MRRRGMLIGTAAIALSGCGQPALCFVMSCDPGHVVTLENACGYEVEWRTGGSDRGTGSSWQALEEGAQAEVTSIYWEVDLVIRVASGAEAETVIPWSAYQEAAESEQSLLVLKGETCAQEGSP